MKDESKKRLDAIFERHAAATTAEQDKDKRRAVEEAEFVAQFARVRDEIIRPVFETMASYLKGRGVDSQISTTEESGSTERFGIHSSASIKLSFYPRAGRSSKEHPAMAVTADKHAKHASFHETGVHPTGGSRSGAAGDVKLEQITVELVESKLVTLIGEVFDN